MKKVKIVAVVGSLRQESLNRQLALAARELLGKRLILSCSTTQICRYLMKTLSFQHQQQSVVCGNR